MDGSTTKNMGKRRALVTKLWEAFPSSLSQLQRGMIDSYVGEVAEYSVEALTRSVEQFCAGKVEDHSGTWVPSIPQLARNVRSWQRSLDMVSDAKGQRDWLEKHGGILEVDFGAGRINMRNFTALQKEWIVTHKGLPTNGDEHIEFNKLGPGRGDPDQLTLGPAVRPMLKRV